MNHNVFLNVLGIRTLFELDHFIKLFADNKEKLTFEDSVPDQPFHVSHTKILQEAIRHNPTLTTVRNQRHSPNCGSVILSCLLELSGVTSGTILDLGTATLNFSSSNTCSLICTGRYNAIFIEKDELASEVIKVQLLQLDNWQDGFLNRTSALNYQVGWDGMGRHFFREFVREGKPFPFYMDSLDNILKKEKKELANNIVCIDLDIDGGEMFIWEQSRFLQTVRPPVVMIEIASFRELGLDGDVGTGFCDFIPAIRKGRAMGYKPVVSWQDNLFFMTDESLSKSSMEYSNDYSFLYNNETWIKEHESDESALPRIKELLHLHKELLK